jgi:hypothetical protein
MPFWVFPSEVRTQVLEQHAELRVLLTKAIAEATPSCSAAELSAAQLALTARQLYARFRSHLAFEDEKLAQIFAVLDAWGPERVREMHMEHERQRRDFDALLEQFESGGDVEPSALALRDLAVTLLRDMEKEEESYLQARLMFANSLPFERL